MAQEYLAAMRQGDTPVPIPNTTVKTLPADDTRLETARESRRLPESFQKFQGEFRRGFRKGIIKKEIPP